MISFNPTVRRSILLLKNVKLSSIVANTSVTEVKESVADNSGFLTPPTKFLGLESHPKWTNLKCWNCDMIPPDYPKFIPKNIEVKSDGAITCDIEGNFCRWVCVVDYCYKEMETTQFSDVYDLIKIMKSHLTKKPCVLIRKALPKTKRQCYCGDSGLTDSMYSKQLDMLEALTVPPNSSV